MGLEPKQFSEDSQLQVTSSNAKAKVKWGGELQWGERLAYHKQYRATVGGGVIWEASIRSRSR